jgi:hypothetical protein
MSTGTTIADETRIAEEIVSVLPAGSVARQLCDDRDSLRYVVQSATLKLRTIVFNRRSLNRLAGDPARAIKLEYLQRDLLRSAIRRAEFRYPRVNRIVTAIRGKRQLSARKFELATV